MTSHAIPFSQHHPHRNRREKRTKPEPKPKPPTWKQIFRRLEIAGPPVPDEAAKTAEQREREERMRRRRWLLGHPRLARAVDIALSSE